MHKKTISDLSTLYKTFVSFPCVLVTVSDNIITIGMVHIFSFSPFLIGIGVSEKRHSYRLLEKSGEFVVNIPTRELIESVRFCGEHSGRDYDKFKETGLSKEDSNTIKVPSIRECPVNLECRVEKVLRTGDHTWFVGRVVDARVDTDYKKEETILYWGGDYRSPGEVINERF